jgi:hypothetical protein
MSRNVTLMPEWELTVSVIKRGNVFSRAWHSVAPALAFFKFVFGISEIPAVYKYDVEITIKEQSATETGG